MKNALKIIILALTIHQSITAQNITATSKPAIVMVNGVQHYAEAFMIDAKAHYKIQDIATMFSDLIPHFNYQANGNQLSISTTGKYLPDGNQLEAATPGRCNAMLVASSVLLNGKPVKANVYQIRNNYCLSEEDIANIFNVGRKSLADKKYTGVEFATNFAYMPTVGKMSIKEPTDLGNLSFNLGRYGIGLEYNDYLFVIHKNEIVRINKDGTNIKTFKGKVAHSLNGYKGRIYFYAYGFKVQSMDLNGEDLRTEICPLYGIHAGDAMQEPQSITYVGDMVFSKYNNKLQNGQWTDEIRWYTTSGRSEEVVYRINSEKRVIGDFFLDKNYVYFSVNWANRKDLNNIGAIDKKEALVEGNVSQPFKIGNKMYFKGTKDNLMYEMPLGSKTGQRKLANTAVDCFYVKDDLIIFQKQEALYTMNLNGTNQKTLVAKGVRNFNVAGEWIVYSERGNTDYGAKVALVKINGSKTIPLP